MDREDVFPHASRSIMKSPKTYGVMANDNTLGLEHDLAMRACQHNGELSSARHLSAAC